jgi:acyl phosphate:glycerol-3-phosphate acyltransferase
MSPAQKTLLALIPAAYLLGSVPFGLIVGLARGVDVRRAGSGNIGATNVGRLLGGRFFAIVFVLDLLKSLVPMLAAGAVVRFRADGALTYLLWLGVGFAAVLGHMFSLFLRFRGGKGVATSTGMLLGLWPYYTLPGLVAAGAFGIAFWRTRIISVGSLAGAATFPIAYVGLGLALGWPVLGVQWPLLAFALLVATLIVYKHRGNLARLRAGTEPRFERRPGTNGDSLGHHTDEADGEGGEAPVTSR